MVSTSDKKRFAILHVPSASASAASDTVDYHDNDRTQATMDVIPSTEQQPSASSSVPDNTQGKEVCEGEGEGEGEHSTIIGAASTNNTTGQETATSQALSVEDTDPSHFLIRATQGHSIKSIDAASYLERLTPTSSSTTLPDTVVHGTYLSTWPLIVEYGGLRCMGRNHVHFATGPSLKSALARFQQQKDSLEENGNDTAAADDNDEPVISGMRRDAQVLIYIDLHKALEAGCPFWRSENNVILSEGIPRGDGKKEKTESEEKDQVDQNKNNVVPLDFFHVVVAKKLGVIWEDGKEVLKLPPELTSRPNPKDKGKGRGKGKMRGKGT